MSEPEHLTKGPRAYEAELRQLRRELKAVKGERDVAAAKLAAIKRLVVTTYGDNKVRVDARELDPSVYQSHEWFLHWSAEGWAHGPSGESGTLGEMLHGIASCYVDRGESTLPPLIGEETEEERPLEVPFDDPLIDLFEAGEEDADDGE